MTMGRWANPQSRMKTEDEFPSQDAVTYIPPISFDTIKKQVRKKKVSRKSKGERISAKRVSLAERLGNSESDETI